MQMAFQFEPKPPVIEGAPIVYRHVMKKVNGCRDSYVEFRLMMNADGTWAHSTECNFQMLCSHGGPMWGEEPTMEAAFNLCVARLLSTALSVMNPHDSCASDEHRRMAQSAKDWLLSIDP